MQMPASRSMPMMAYASRSNGADIDETLFGSHNKTRAGKGRNGKAATHDISITGKDTVRVRPKMGRAASLGAPRADPNIVCISAGELNRLRENATILTKEQQDEQRRQSEDQYAERMARSKARKEKMMQMEEERKKNAQLMTAEEKGSLAQKNSVLERAKMMMDENMDDVKHMNQSMLYSKVVTIRDAQLQEKRQVQAEREEEERQLDMMMEIERLKALKMYEEREKQRGVDQRRGAGVIIEQIKDRQSQRMREEESRDQERSFILKQIESLKSEEVEQQRLKHLAADRLMKEVSAANLAAMKLKEEKMLAERLEEQKIIEYQQAREQRERELEEEKQRLAAEKEAETMKMRARQEKAADKASEMDALRAKRAMEAAERNARAKERMERERLQAINKEMDEARQQQQAEKERRLGEQAKFERDEFERIIEVQLQQEEAERQRQEEEHQMRILHSHELRGQIGGREEKSLQERRDFLEEGNVVRAQVAAERRKLERIKARKIEQLAKSGVPDKYRAGLTRQKISI